ncbi:MAG: hypothetical protein IID33_15250 [Planctomycetes bacterium]|nr:hypothetical protein [Planctomycetota bacterium]
MRDRSIDEFESLFERASIPVLDIRELPITRVCAVIKDDALDDSVFALAAYLEDRFSATVSVLHPDGVDTARLHDAAKEKGFDWSNEPFGSTAELVGQISIGKSQLVLLPELTVGKPTSSDEAARSSQPALPVVDLDAVVTGTTPPILTVRSPISDPRVVFGNILHGLTGNFRQTQNFAYSFTLAEDHGRLSLLHAIEDSEVQDVRDTLQLSPDITESTGNDLVEALTHHGERYLKAVVAAARKRPFDVGYQLAVGEIVPLVKAELKRGDYGLLVVGSHTDGHSHVSANDYQLLHQVWDIPVLAL